jgi:hypothetical protein
VVAVVSPSPVMAVLARSSYSAAAVALVALALVSAVAGEVFFQEKFDGEPPDLNLSLMAL